MTKNRIDALCKNNQTGAVLMRTDVPKNFLLYELKMTLAACHNCDSYHIHRGEGYCLQPSDRAFIKKEYAYHDIAQKRKG
jgi:hypothetical protein